jgi:hypothetical protein
MSRICNHVTEATEEKEGQEENPNRLLVLQLLARLPEEVSPVFQYKYFLFLKQDRKREYWY